MTADPQLLRDAHDAFLAGLAITESEIITRDKVDNAQRWASMANVKLMQLQCQFKEQAGKEKAH